MISLIHPSRGRPKKAFQTVVDWFVKADCPVEHILSVDVSDNQSQNYVDEAMRTMLIFGIKTTYVLNHGDCVVSATNRAAEAATGDILLYMSDDFQVPDSWCSMVENEFKKYSGPTLIKVDDCLQKFEVTVLTIPMMNRELYNKLGYFWHPEYKSMFVDEDLYWTAKKLNALKLAPHLKFPHEHVSNGKAPNDETYIRSAANWVQGQNLFAKRKAAGFPL